MGHSFLCFHVSSQGFALRILINASRNGPGPAISKPLVQAALEQGQRPQCGLLDIPLERSSFGSSTFRYAEVIQKRETLIVHIIHHQKLDLELNYIGSWTLSVCLAQIHQRSSTHKGEPGSPIHAALNRFKGVKQDSLRK